MNKYCRFIIFGGLSIQAQSFFLFLMETLNHPPTGPDPLFGPLSVLYIYNEIQIHISRTVSTPRVTVWILLTLISWIMLIFTLPAHRQQTPRDMAVVTAVSVCCRVSAVCVWWIDCHVVKPICMWKGGLITSLMQIRDEHARRRHWWLTAGVKKTVWAPLLMAASPPVWDGHNAQEAVEPQWIFQYALSDKLAKCLDGSSSQ